MYGQTWYVHKYPKNESLRSQICTNKCGKYTGNNLRGNHHLQQNELINREDADVSY